MVVHVGLEFAEGETWNIPISCVDVNGAPLDITGGFVQVRIASSTALILDKTLPATGSGYTGGKANIIIAVADTSTVVPQLYQYEARSILPNGTVTDQQVGSLNVRHSLYVDFPYTAPSPAATASDLDLTSGVTRLSAII